MPITNRNLQPGTRLVATYKKIEYSALVLEDGRIRVDSDAADQPEFKSLSAAGSAIMGGIACNGWRFWSVDGDDAGGAQRAARVATEQIEAAQKPKGKKLITRVPNQKGVPDGSLKIWCASCLKSHVIEGDTVPDVCPEGHSTEPAAY